MRPEAGSRMAYSTGSPANARAVTSNPSAGVPSSTNSPFFVPTSSSVMSDTSGDRGKDVDAVVLADGRVRRAALPAHIDVDVAAQAAALVEDPAREGGLLALERGEYLGDGRAVQRMIGAAAGQALERFSEADGGHRRVIHLPSTAGRAATHLWSAARVRTVGRERALRARECGSRAAARHPWGRRAAAVRAGLPHGLLPARRGAAGGGPRRGQRRFRGTSRAGRGRGGLRHAADWAAAHGDRHARALLA